MKKGIAFRLSFMMFLQFFIWGGWFVTLGTFLGNNLSASDGQIGLAYSTQSWGAIIAPFVIGLIADRYFNAERILGVIHLLGSGLMYMMATSTDFEAFYPFLLGYMILYMPTLALVNSVAFNQMNDPSKEFSKIRVWGTIGWVIAGLVISYVFSWDSAASIALGDLENTFWMCSTASLLLGFFSFTLPSTPPTQKGQSKNFKTMIGLDALSLLKDRSYMIFFLSSVAICIPLAFYYQNTNLFLTEINMEDATGKMAFGQVSEVLFMLALPVFLGRFGLKKTLLLGMLAWVVRYVLFAYGDVGSMSWMLLLGIALHGVCYDFFFVSGQIYTDTKAGENYKSSAQGLITLATYGVGMLVGFWIAGIISETYATIEAHDWQQIWLFPAGFAVVVAVMFVFSFKNEIVEYK